LFNSEQLIIFAGPTCSGKTALIELIKKGELCSFAEQLGITDPQKWSYIKAFDLYKAPQCFVGQLVLHYDFHAHYSNDNKTFNNLSELAGKSDNVFLVTLCALPDVLLKRNSLRIADIFKNLLHKPQEYKKIAYYLECRCKAQQFLKDDSLVLKLYDTWFDFCSVHLASANHHWIVDMNKSDMTAKPLEEIKSNMLPHINNDG
jgi:hypothetical protein